MRSALVAGGAPAAIAGGTVAAIVGVVAIASAVQGPTPVPVASNPPTPIGALACEQDWTLEPGATVHDASKAAVSCGSQRLVDSVSPTAVT